MNVLRAGRRHFLTAAALTASAAAAGACAAAPLPATATPPPPESTPTPTPEPAVTPAPVWPGPEGAVVTRRALADGALLSVVGFGGIVVMNETQDDANALVAQAIARGINYFDVAPSYGNAESRLGPALEPYRKDAFLACKTEARSKTGAASSLRQSLERLRTDHFDLFQLHGVTKMDEVEQITAADGALAAFIEARDQGLIRRIGFSAHSEEAALALLERFQFDTILFPVNWSSWYQGKFGPAVLDKAEQLGVSILALKSLAKRDWRPGEVHVWPKCWYAPVDTPEEAALALRFTLSRPVTAAVSPSHAELLWAMCAAATEPAPLTESEEAGLAQAATSLDPVFPLA